MAPQYTEENPNFIKKHSRSFDLLIVTVTSIEKTTVHKFLKPIAGKKTILKINYNKHTYYIGKFGIYNAVHVSCKEMGSLGRNSSIVTTSDAIAVWHPKLVLMTGIAFGVNKKNQKIGDVLVSKSLISYEPQRIGKTKNVDRGSEITISSLLIDRFENVTDWNYKINNIKARKIIGALLSGEKLIDNKKIRDTLVEKYNSAVGGEMEGIGVSSACDGKVNDYIVVKGICDFADGDKGKNKTANQRIACQSAVSLCLKVFESKFAFLDIGLIPNVIVKSSSAKQSTASANIKLILGSLKTQITNQLSKQINSGKYLPKTYIETNDAKDHLRYLCDSIFYSSKVFHEIRILDFRYFNNLLSKKSNYIYTLDLQKNKNLSKHIDINNGSKLVSKWIEHLKNKLQELSTTPISSNSSHKFKYKIEEQIDELNFLKSKVTIVTETAGQGKTNFLCDFADNFLLKRSIPALFFTGAELDATNIKQSIINRIFPDSNDFNFKQLIEYLKRICNKEKKYFVLVIDGLNENPNSKLFSSNLELLLTELTKYSFVKIVLSCRTEYYQKNFTNLEETAFKDDIRKITWFIRSNIDDTVSDKLIKIYFEYFNIQYHSIKGSIKRSVYEQLSSNFLLLRIFCEAYQNKKIDFLSNIYKVDLFTKYYSTKCKEINERLKTEDEFGIAANINIKKFINKVVQLMIEKKTYANIPLDDIIENENTRVIYIRFLDENILLKRDLKVEGEDIFTNSEVVNFTFDEFRDFLISKYLIDVLYAKSPHDFINFLKTELTTHTLLLEGCSTFLFYMSRESKDEILISIIKKQFWFGRAFLKCVFELNDSLVTNEDKIYLKRLWVNNSEISYFIISNIIYERYNSNYFVNLGMEFLLENLREFSQELYYINFTKIFTNYEFSHIRDRIYQQSLIDDLTKILDTHEFENDSRYHSLFELLIYMFLNDESWQIESLYERYFYKYKSISIAQLDKAMQSKNSKLKECLVNFKRYYANSI